MTDPAHGTVLVGPAGDGGFRLVAEQEVPAAPAEVFPFFADAHNLEAITPPFLHFRVLTPAPIEMRAGAVIDYRLRLHGLPIRWRTLITAWEPPARFVDQQVRGPYGLWRHEHRFTALPDGRGVRLQDDVRFAHAGGRVAHRFVARDVERIFRFRQERLAERFG